MEEKSIIDDHLKSSIFSKVNVLRTSGKMMAPSETKFLLSCACTFHPVSPHRSTVTSTEAKYWHLPITPFHGGLQKVKWKVDGFTELKKRNDDYLLVRHAA
jgi:hypothetical protein